MDHQGRLLAEPPREFVDVLMCVHPVPQRYVPRGTGVESYLVEVAPRGDQAALMSYLVELLDGPPIDNAELRALLDRISPWWGFETKCARAFLEGLRGSLMERMKTDA